MRDIGKNIKTLRQERNITQEELAEKLFVTRQTVSNYELGRTRPDIDMLMQISQVLEADMNELLYGPSETISRSRVIVKTSISVACTALLVILYLWLSDWAWEQKHLQWNMTPDWLIRIFLKPAVLLSAGWTVLQLLGLFAKLQPLPKKPAQILLICTLVLIIGYLLAVMPMVLSVLFSLDIFNGWPLTVSFFVLGLIPRLSLPDLYLILSFLAGSMLWLAGVGNRRRP